MPSTSHGMASGNSGSSQACNGGSAATAQLPQDGGSPPMSQLICRVRPCDKPSPLVSVLEREARVEVCPEKGHPGEPLRFDRVLGSRGSQEQEELFECVRPAVVNCFHGGANCTIVTYGGPQSGKSYTLSGFFMHVPLRGLAPRAIQLVVELAEASGTTVPGIEASFFEIQGDVVYDLLPKACPKISMQESSEPPFVVMDPNLTAHRCDGAPGHNRLLDTYFTGLEHRRKGAHTCFQIEFVQPGGHRSCLRFVEMAWPRPQPLPAGAVAAAAPGRAQSSTPQSLPNQNRAECVLDHIVQGKLTGMRSPSYRSNFLSLLLKPCFEGGALLYFIYCLRLEQIQLPCLAHAAPLLAKLHLWLGKSRGTLPESVSPTTAAPAANVAPRSEGPPVIPPLKLNKSASGTVLEPMPAAPDTMSPGSSSSGVSGACSPDASPAQHDGGNPNLAREAVMQAAHSQAQPGHSQAHLGHSQTQPAPVVEKHQVAVEKKVEVQLPQQYEFKVIYRCGEYLQVKQRLAEILRADALHAEATLRDITEDLAQLKAIRQATGDSGPSEHETKLKMLYERVMRTMKNTCDQVRRIEEEIQTIAQMCEAIGHGVAIPPVYDSYNVREEDVQHMVAHAGKSAQKVAAHASSEGAGGPQAASAPTGHPSVPALRLTGSVVPQLPLSQLPQEHPEIQPQVAGGSDGQSGSNSLDPLSPSSSSTCSSREPSLFAQQHHQQQQQQQSAMSPFVVQPPTAWIGGATSIQASVVAPALQASLPKTPLQNQAARMDAAACGAMAHHAAGMAALGGAAAGCGHGAGAHLQGQWRYEAGSPPVPMRRNAGGSISCAALPVHSTLGQADGDAPMMGNSVSVEAWQQQQHQQQPGVPCSPDLRQTSSGNWRLSSSPSVGQIQPVAVATSQVGRNTSPSPEQWDGGQFRKSHSTQSLRLSGSVGLLAPPGSPGVPVGAMRGAAAPPSVPTASPMLGYRSDRVAESPQRGSVMSGPGVAAPAPPKRAVTAMVTRPAWGTGVAGVARPPGPRATTPAARMASPVASTEHRVRGSPSQPGRQVSAQGPLRFQRSNTAESAPKIGHRPSSKHPSPERQRAAFSVSPMRAAWSAAPVGPPSASHVSAAPGARATLGGSGRTP